VHPRAVGRVSLLALAGLVCVVAPRGLVGFVLAYALPVALFAAGILALSSLMRVVALDAPWALIYILYYPWSWGASARPSSGCVSSCRPCCTSNEAPPQTDES
jgi:hypothetical protein